VSEGSGTIAVAGAAQQLLPASPGRRGFFIQNNSAGPLSISREGTATATGAIIVPAGQMFTTPASMPCPGPVSIYGATQGSAFSYGDW
jgi:hypothetical protein